MISFLDPTYPARLPSRNEEVDFIVVDTDPSMLTLSLRYPDATMETIFQAGLVGRGYTITRDGAEDRTFHIKRMGGWPRGRFQFAFSEVDVATSAPALQPIAYAPRAAWALDSSLVGGQLADRVGAYTLTNTFASTPSNRARRRAGWGNTFVQLADSAGQSPDFIYGSTAFTVAFCASARDTGGAQFLLGSQTGTSGFSNSWELWRNNSGRLEYRCGPSGGTAVSSGSLPIMDVDWAYYSLRRNAARTHVILGVNNAFVTLAVSTPTPSIACVLQLLQYQTGFGWQGALDDVMIWDGEKSDAELIAQYRTALGV
jgi:hypothetical protein